MCDLHGETLLVMRRCVAVGSVLTVHLLQLVSSPSLCCMEGDSESLRVPTQLERERAWP